MNTINLPESKKVSIVNLSIAVRCNSCGWLWTVKAGLNGEFPVWFDECIRCKKMNKEGE